MSIISVNARNVWQYYEKVSKYEAKCKFCRKKYIYAQLSGFTGHIKIKHKVIFDYENACKERQEWPWTCFKYNDTTTLQCLFCPDKFQLNMLFLTEHLTRKHLDKIQDYVLHEWVWKYCEITVDGSNKIKCNICFKIHNIYCNKHLYNHIEKEHSKEIRNAEEGHEIFLLPKSVENSQLVEIQENIWKYYEKMQNLQAKCKFCSHMYSYSSDISSLRKHINTVHTKILNWESAVERKSWAYYYRVIFHEEKTYLKCLFCHDLYLSLDFAEKHSMQHSRNIEHLATNTLSDDWIFKYYIQSSDSDNKMKCNICYKSIDIQLESDMIYHTLARHLKIVQQNISEKKIQKLWQNYIDLRNFQARCQFCDFQSYYINTTNFSEHVEENHIKIYNYEETCGEIWPFKFFKYVNATLLHCSLCEMCFWRSDEVSLTNHLTHQHFFQQPCHFIDYGWIWKYCDKINNFQVKCFCENVISLDISLWHFNNHIEEHLSMQQYIRTQRPLDVAGPSGSQSN